MDSFNIKEVLDVGAFGLLAVIIFAAIRGGPKLIGLWTRGVVAMEKIANDMQEFRGNAVEMHEELTAQRQQSIGYVASIRGDIGEVRTDVLRVESKVDKIGARP